MAVCAPMLFHCDAYACICSGTHIVNICNMLSLYLALAFVFQSAFLLCNLLYLHGPSLWWADRGPHPCLTNEETCSERGNDLPKASHLGSGRTETKLPFQS